MSAAPAAEIEEKSESAARGAKAVCPLRVALARESLIFAVFVALTALMTWPWVLNLRDAVADPGDPYMIAWTLWWDYHQTFNDPLRLFHANVFYPYQYTLAFSENDYGIALLFFPAFALGARPLTVNSLATFLGFAFSGYGTFRLARTLTGSNVAAWVAGLIFAFVPFRFYLLSHLHYLFAGWIPLLAEALVLYVRKRSRRRAAWLGVAFLMNALTCITWFIMTLPPLLLMVVLFVARDRALLRERAFWLRACVALGLASLALLPFLLPYYWVSEMYGLKWEPWEYAYNSPSPLHWLAAEGRNKLWGRMGEQYGGEHKLFPGLLAPLLALVAVRLKLRASGWWSRSKDEGFVEPQASQNDAPSTRHSKLKALSVAGLAVEVLMVTAAVVAVLSLGYGEASLRVLGVQVLRPNAATHVHALYVIASLLAVRLGLAFAARRARRVGEARQKSVVAEGEGSVAGPWLGVGLIWLAWGFVSSLGANLYLNVFLREHVLLFRSLRYPTRWAMICYVGLALLAGVGAAALARKFGDGSTHRSATPTRPGARDLVRGASFARRLKLNARCLIFVALLTGALLFELRAFPLGYVRGEADPDSLSLRLRETPMHGGLVELPSGLDVERHRYVLRSADHGRPLVNATASFISPLTDQINRATRDGSMRASFLDLLESIPASYLVIHNDLVPADHRASYEAFLARGVSSGRLRFINRFDGRDDLYAVAAIEPNAASEAALPFEPSTLDLATLVSKDPINVLGPYREWSQTLFRLHLLTDGRLPRYDAFMKDFAAIGRGVVPGFEEQDERLEANLREFVEELARRPTFKNSYGQLDDARFVERLHANASLPPDDAERAALVAALSSGWETRAGVLLKIARDRRFAEREHYRSLVVLHYFGYFRRNPDDPPDGDLNGVNFWVEILRRQGDPSKLAIAFMNSGEYLRLKENEGRKY